MGADRPMVMMVVVVMTHTTRAFSIFASLENAAAVAGSVKNMQ